MSQPISGCEILDKELNGGKSAIYSSDPTNTSDLNASSGAIVLAYIVPVQRANVSPAYNALWQPKYDICLKDAFARAVATTGAFEDIDIIKFDGTTGAIIGTIAVVGGISREVTRMVAWLTNDLNILGLSAGESIMIRATSGITGGCDLELSFVNIVTP